MPEGFPESLRLNRLHADVALVAAALGPPGGQIPVDVTGKISRKVPHFGPARDYWGDRNYWTPLRRRRALVAWRDELKCQYCGDLGYDLDHVIPRVAGGPSTVGNLALSCRPCNLRKGATIL